MRHCRNSVFNHRNDDKSSNNMELSARCHSCIAYSAVLLYWKDNGTCQSEALHGTMTCSYYYFCLQVTSHSGSRITKYILRLFHTLFPIQSLDLLTRDVPFFDSKSFLGRHWHLYASKLSIRHKYEKKKYGVLAQHTHCQKFFRQHFTFPNLYQWPSSTSAILLPNSRVPSIQFSIFVCV